jgi:hypothetical protein
LRHVTTRARLCISCHSGVDHDLIASGHPALQFELDNYTATMPPHWQRQTEGARAWAVGEFVAFERELEKPDTDYSKFACFDCHHNLSGGMWRQERGWSGRPGVPSLNLQHWPAVRAILARMGRSTEMPSPAEVQRTVSAVDRLSWSDADVRSMMRALASDDRLLDIQAAGQVALSMQALASARPNLVTAATRSAIDTLFAEVRDRDAYDPRRFAAALRALRASL